MTGEEKELAADKNDDREDNDSYSLLKIYNTAAAATEIFSSYITLIRV